MTEAFNIDCMEYMKTCSDNSFDLAIVDPPYGIKELTGKEVCHGRGKLKRNAFNQGHSKFIQWNKKPSKEYFEMQEERFKNHCSQLELFSSKDGKVI